MKKKIMVGLLVTLMATSMVFAQGAGAASRKAIGVTVFAGMLAATIFGIMVVPGLFALFQNIREFAKKSKKQTP